MERRQIRRASRIGAMRGMLACRQFIERARDVEKERRFRPAGILHGLPAAILGLLFEEHGCAPNAHYTAVLQRSTYSIFLRLM